jgi:2-dehydropantoate 2-reductase
LIIVLMRKNQVSTILPILAANEATTHILFMYNNAAGFNEIVRSLGRGWASIGFPGAGGTLDGPVVRCGLIPQQPTTLGELDGGVTVRLKQIESVFGKAGFPTVISRQMDAWLKTHVSFITSVAGALYMVDCNNYALAKTPDGVPLMVRGVREGFRVLRKLGVTVTPFKLRVLFEWLPFPVPVAYRRNYLNSSMGDYFLARHTRAAREEIQELAGEFRILIGKAGIRAPALGRLYRYVDKPGVG